MRVWGYLPVLLGILIIGTISSNEAFAATVTIDDFQTGSSLLTVLNTIPIDLDSVTGPGIIPSPSGQRDVTLFWDSGLDLINYGVFSGAAHYDEDPIPDGYLELFWDANGAGLNADLTDGSTNDQFELFISSTTAFDLELELEDSTTAFDSVGLSQSALPGLTVVSIPFSSFTGLDFTDMRSILLRLDFVDTTTGTNMEIDFFQTSGQAPVGSSSIPIDSTPMLVAGSEMNSIWITLSIIAAVGVGAVIVTKRLKI